MFPAIALMGGPISAIALMGGPIDTVCWPTMPFSLAYYSQVIFYNSNRFVHDTRKIVCG